MPTYVWTVKDRYGDRLVKEVPAESVEQAKAQLLAEGCTELELAESEIEAAVQAGRKPGKFFSEEIKVTAAQRLKHRNAPAKTYWSVLSAGLVRTKGIVIPVLLLGVWQVWSRNYLSALLVGVSLLAWAAFLVSNGLPSIFFRKLVSALEWSRWHQALRLVRIIKLINRVHSNKVTPFFLAHSRAKALAGLGRLPEAVAGFAPWENQPGCPGWLHKLFMAGIYDLAGQYDQGVEYSRRSIAEKPTAAGFISLAEQLVRHQKDVIQARAALAKVENATLNENEKRFLLRCRGIIAWREGDFLTAKKELAAALELMELTKNGPYAYGNICVAQAYLCCALAQLGDLLAAQKCFAEARVYLVATDETELIQECRQALGESAN